MIYTEMTIKAMQIAYKAHAGQVDYSNVPYVFHPYHLAEQMDDEISCTVALLHDVVEDTDLTFTYLEQIFPAQVLEIVRLLTHDENIELARAGCEALPGIHVQTDRKTVDELCSEVMNQIY